MFRDKEYYTKCILKKDTAEGCPRFKVSQILEKAKTNYSSIALTGAVIRILITWQCDFDFTKVCPPPTYSFQAIDEGANLFG